MKQGSSLLIVLFLLGVHKLYSQSNSVENGKTVYTIFCQSCHMENGLGEPAVYPPLAGANNLSNKDKLVQVILRGMRGELTVKGVKYNAEMAPIDLTDQEVADVINYIRNAWGNKASLIKKSDVSPAKKAIVKGYTPF
ncbi:MAG: hypothetical protein RL732_1515 [Bacteroidota bacterium]